MKHNNVLVCLISILFLALIVNYFVGRSTSLLEGLSAPAAPTTPPAQPDLSGKWTYINMGEGAGGVLPVRCNPSKTNSVLCASAAANTKDEVSCGWGEYSASNPPTTKYTYETGCPGWDDASGIGVCKALNCDTTPPASTTPPAKTPITNAKAPIVAPMPVQ
jgi:hypothetical protein